MAPKVVATNFGCKKCRRENRLVSLHFHINANNNSPENFQQPLLCVGNKACLFCKSASTNPTHIATNCQQ